MVVIQKKSNRKSTGGRYKAKALTKQIVNQGSEPTLTKIGSPKSKGVRLRGGTINTKLLRTETVNLFDGKAFSQTKMISVIENAANRHYVRRNILTKGTIVNTEKGKARVTNRPGQEGVVNAVLVQE
ncbi:30S ribosomal protein S8e [Candidatus Woesearchaeota archaeon]|nr:30S ribosomal protein S8e [Candidatus Woesearchaeota archaeon]